MSTRSSTRNLFPPLDNAELTIRRRSRTDPTLLKNSEMAAEGNGDLLVPDLRTIEELCQPSLNGQGGPVAPIAIRATNFRLKNDMIQQVQNSCQFHGLLSDDANKHLDKFLHVTQSIKVNGVTDDALRLYLFPHSLTHHATVWFDQIDTFYNGLTLRHHDTINVATGRTFMKRRPEECYDLIENMTAHHNDWDTSAQRSESSSSITSSSDTKIAALKAEIAEINKNLMRVLQVNQQVKAVTPNYETCGGPRFFSDCPATVGNTQNVYAAGAYQGPPCFNQNQNGNNQNHNLQNQNRNQGNHNPQGNNQGRNQFFQGANQGQNQPPSYQAPAYQAPVYQALVHQPQIPQPQVVTTNEFTNFMKANDSILKNMQTNMNSLTNSNLELKNTFGQFMKMNTASSSGSGTLSGNAITNPKEDLKCITTRSGIAYQGPMIPTTTSSSPVVERETEATKDTVHPTNNGSTKDVQPPIVLTESLILNAGPVISPIIEPVASPTNGEAMINSIQNGDQPLPVIAQVSLAGTAQNAPPTLKDPNNKTAKDLWDALERQMRGSKYGEQDRKAVILYEYETFKAIEGEQFLDTYLRYLQVVNDLKKCGYKNDNCELNYKFMNNLQQEWKQYATLMRQTKNLMDINIDALYNILKQNWYETDTQEKDKNKAKNNKTKHIMEKIGKDKVIQSQKKKVKARGQQKPTPRKSKSILTKPK
nr:reverse transcriptase domain-containing protein [Tanacetum cinerariifolium]